jgi:hypothetical protein
MKPDEFALLVEGVAPGVQQKSVLDTIRFRVGGRTFATLGWPTDGWAVVKLSVADQHKALFTSDAFTREPDHRRNSGVTLVRLEGVDPDILADVLGCAWRLAYLGGGQSGAAAHSARRARRASAIGLA